MVTADADVIISGRSDGGDTWLGEAVADVSDLDADGYPDLALGGPWYDGGAADAGAVFVVRGRVRLASSMDTDDAAATIVGDTIAQGVGWAVLGPGDLDADGNADLVLAAPGASAAASEAGAVWVFHDGTALSGTLTVTDADTRIDGSTDRAWLGVDLAAADLNQDGLPDLIVGADGAEAAFLFRDGGP